MAESNHNWPRIGLLAGASMGVLDTGLMVLLGIEMRLGTLDVGLFVMAFYAATFAALGWLMGRLYEARLREARDAEIIRERGEALAESREHARRLEQLAALGRLAAGVAHEVRNPLGVIKSSAGLLLEDLNEDNARARRAGSFILDEIDRLDGFVRRLLEYARPVTVETTRVPAQTLCERAVMLAGAEPDAVTITCATEQLEVDGELFEQALSTLVVNAMQATEGAGQVAIEAEADRIRVRDDGPGIDPEHADSIFEPFFTRRAQGTGLGLPMARRIIEAHGGTLTFETGGGLGPGGRGASFLITLSTL